MSHPITSSSTRARIDTATPYYIGSWRRSPVNLGRMPQALNVDSRGKLCLANFDAPRGNLFFLRSEDGEHWVIETADGGAVFVGKNLVLTNRRSDAAVWTILPYTPFRGGPMDVAFQLRLEGDSRILGSVEHTGEVFLVDPIEAEDAKDKKGNLLVNIGWEATPDCDEACEGELTEVPQWLQEMLLAW
jgi:hypothetical protein